MNIWKIHRKLITGLNIFFFFKKCKLHGVDYIQRKDIDRK